MIGVGLPAGLSGSRRARTVQDPLPALDLDWATNRSLPASYGPTPSFSRASTGNYFDGQGILRSAAVNAPRFNHTYNGTSWVSKGLLMEEQRTNLLTYSNTFSNGSWTKARGTVSQDVVGPDGATSGWTATCNETGGGFYGDSTPSSGASASGTYTISVFAKKGNNGYFILQISDGANYTRIFFDLNSIAVGSPVTSGTYSSTSGSMVNCGNGWYRCSLTTTKGSSSGATGTIFFTCDSASSANCTSGQTNYFYNAQLEFGAFATSAIVTTSAQVTRSADVCQMQTGSDVTGFFNPIEGTLVVEFDSGIPSTITKAAEIIAFADSTNNNRMFFDFYTPDNAYRWYIDETPTGVSSSLKPGPYVGDYVTQKSAMCYKLNDLAISLNGAAPLTDTSQPMPININRMEIGYNTPAAGPNRYTGHFSRIRYYPVRLTNAKLQELST